MEGAFAEINYRVKSAIESDLSTMLDPVAGTGPNETIHVFEHAGQNYRLTLTRQQPVSNVASPP